MNNVRSIERLQRREGKLGIAGSENGSWHSEYRGSAYIYVGGLPFSLNEGDILQIFSQYGVVLRVDLARKPPDEKNKIGVSRGFAFLCYEDERSCILAVDNFNGIKILGRTIRVDHVKNYRRKDIGKDVNPEDRKLIDGEVPILASEEAVLVQEEEKIHERLVLLEKEAAERSKEEVTSEERESAVENERQKTEKKIRHVQKALAKLDRQCKHHLISEKQRQLSAVPLEQKLVKYQSRHDRIVSARRPSPTDSP